MRINEFDNGQVASSIRDMKTSRIIRFFHHSIGVLLFLAALSSWAAPKEYFVYFGTFAKTGGKGIYVSRLNLETGNLSNAELAAETANAGFLAVHPNRKFLYATGNLKKPEQGKGAVNAFAIDPETGKLTFLNQESSGGKGPAHVSVDTSGKCVMVANYGGGSVAALPIKADGHVASATAFIQHTGSSANPDRQAGPHAHSINVDPANHYAFAADLGLDKILIYKLDPEKGSLVPNEPASVSVAPGSGPRHFAFHPFGRFGYVINEMLCTITAFSYDAAKGELKEIQTVSTLPDGQKVETGFSTAEVQVHPTGKFLYGSNRGHNSIVVFEIDGNTGKLTKKQTESTQGKIPRNFGIDPTGQYLLAANQDSDDVVVFKIDQKTGEIKATGQKISVPMPVCVKFVESKSDGNLPKVAEWPTDDQFPGKGPIQKAQWFQGLWSKLRATWWDKRDQDKGAVVFLGDSITQGWTTLAKDFPNLKVINRGISGDTTRGVLFRLKEDVLDTEPKAVVLLIGTNDIGLSGSPEDTAANVGLILDALKAYKPTMPVIVCKVMPSSAGLFRPAEKIKKLNSLVDEKIKGDSQFIRCDTWSIFVSENEEPKKAEFPDLLHPNAIGYGKWIDALKPIFAKLNLETTTK